MAVSVVRSGSSHRLVGDGPVPEAANRFLEHLQARCYSAATVPRLCLRLVELQPFPRRACTRLGRRLSDRSVRLPGLAIQGTPLTIDQGRSARTSRSGTGHHEPPGGVGPRFCSSTWSWSGHASDNPVPVARRSSGCAHRTMGCSDTRARDGRGTAAGCVRQPQRLPESLDVADVGAFLVDLGTHRDRAIVLAMVFGGLRACEGRAPPPG